MTAKTIGISFAALILVSAVVAVGMAAFGDDGPPAVVSADEGGDDETSADGDSDSISTDNDGLSGGPDRDLPLGGDGDSFVGLTRDEAAALAEIEGRAWRIGREDGEWLPVTEDYRVGRVTFELESDRVTAATIEQPLDDPGDADDPSTPLDPDDEDAAAILAAATTQILTVDHSFGVGGPPPFSDVRVATAAGGTGGTPLAALTLEAMASAVTDTGASIEFVDDSRAMIEELFDAQLPGVAVLTVGAVRLEDGRAEVDVELWCGSLCGVFLTYEVLETDDGWQVTGPIGPIAVS